MIERPFFLDGLGYIALTCLTPLFPLRPDFNGFAVVGLPDFFFGASVPFFVFLEVADYGLLPLDVLAVWKARGVAANVFCMFLFIFSASFACRRLTAEPFGFIVVAWFFSDTPDVLFDEPCLFIAVAVPALYDSTVFLNFFTDGSGLIIVLSPFFANVMLDALIYGTFNPFFAGFFSGFIISIIFYSSSASFLVFISLILSSVRFFFDISSDTFSAAFFFVTFLFPDFIGVFDCFVVDVSWSDAWFDWGSCSLLILVRSRLFIFNLFYSGRTTDTSNGAIFD